VLFATSAATAQEPDPHGWVAEVQERLAEAWTGGDAEAISALFVEDAIYWPLAGGTLEGAGEIRRQFEQEFARQMVPTSVEITSSRTERLNGMVFDVGTFTATMPQDTGGETRGEYVVLAEDADEGVMIRRLMAFPTRRVPEGRRSARRSLSPATGDRLYKTGCCPSSSGGGDEPPRRTAPVGPKSPLVSTIVTSGVTLRGWAFRGLFLSA
jgi:uncharacterized protein (TIGR02246 family)